MNLMPLLCMGLFFDFFIWGSKSLIELATADVSFWQNEPNRHCRRRLGTNPLPSKIDADPHLGPRIKRCEPIGELIQFPLLSERGRLVPRRFLVPEAWQRSISVHGGERSEKPQAFCHRGKSSSLKRSLETAVSLQQRCSTCCPNSRCARHLVGGIAAQGDKVRDLGRIDAISRANLSGADMRNFACADGIKDGGVVRGELERIAVAARNNDTTAALLFRCGGGCKKIIRLEAGRLQILKSACGNTLRQHIELLEQVVVKFTAALVSGKFLMPVCGDVQRVPGNKYSARLLVAIEAQQHIGKAKDSAGGLPATPENRFREGVIGTMCK